MQDFFEQCFCFVELGPPLNAIALIIGLLTTCAWHAESGEQVNRHIIGSGLLAAFLSFLRWFLESTSVLMRPGVFCGTTVDAELVRSSEVLSLVYTIEKTNLQQTIHTTSADRRLDIDTSSKKTILLGHAYHCL